jgi:methionyl-tRNA formyltransferase
VAAELGIPVIQPERLSDPSAVLQIREWAPELIVVAAFGQLLRSELLELPIHGCVNVHASLLPRWRGAAPIQAAIAAGDAETGVTIMEMDRGMDTGGIISQMRIPIDPADTGGSLSDRLSRLGAHLLLSTLRDYLSGQVRAIPQDGAQSSRAPMLKKEDGWLDPSSPAVVLERRVRAFNPWPGAYIHWEGNRLKVQRAHVAKAPAEAGSLLVIEEQPALSTIAGALILDEVQPAGKKPMPGRAFLSGARGRWH